MGWSWGGVGHQRLRFVRLLVYGSGSGLPVHVRLEAASAHGRQRQTGATGPVARAGRAKSARGCSLSLCQRQMLRCGNHHATVCSPHHHVIRLPLLTACIPPPYLLLLPLLLPLQEELAEMADQYEDNEDFARMLEGEKAAAAGGQEGEL